MKKSLATRRAPRRIGTSSGSDTEDQSTPIVSAVKRPPLQPRTSKPKSSSTRLSFSRATSPAERQSDEASVYPKRPVGGLGRLAAERNASRHDDERPRYSKEALEQLAGSTPRTPRTSLPADDDYTSLVKAGQQVGSLIPSELEIREKIERRRRLAKEQEFISIHGDVAEAEQSGDVMLISDGQSKYGPTRLVADDEDLAEGFDEFVQDERVVLSRKATRAAHRAKRAEIAKMIADAESEIDTDDDLNAQIDGYERAQTRAGIGRREHGQSKEAASAREPISVPDLASVIANIQAKLHAKKQERDQIQSRLDELYKEKLDLKEREEWTQSQLKEAASKYERFLQMRETVSTSD